jgi:hypothetical protein
MRISSAEARGAIASKEVDLERSKSKPDKEKPLNIFCSRHS